jgi:putative hemolysin
MRTMPSIGLACGLGPVEDDYHTIARFALFQLGLLSEVGDAFTYEGWRIEIVNMDRRRIDKLLAHRSNVTVDLD